MNSNFTSTFFQENRERLNKQYVDTELVVITANGVMQRNSDVTYGFRQDSSFWYLTGIDQADIVLVMDGGDEYLILPERDEIVQKFDGYDDIAKLSQLSGIKDVLDEKSGWPRLNKRLKSLKEAGTLLPAAPYIEKHGIYTNPARSRLVERMKGANTSLHIKDLRPALTKMRAVKQPLELEAIQTAINLTSEALRHVQSNLQSYKFEYEIEADITACFRSRGKGHAFAPIVASGSNACTIHHMNNDGGVAADDLVVLDVGAEVSNYAADITRTYAVGKPSKRQEAVFNSVLSVQKFAFDLLRPGLLLKDYEQSIEKFMGEELRKLGLIKTLDRQEVRKYYPHATTHFLGLDTHDVGEYDKPLSPDMVVTCEPGIYIPEEGIGVRIEDDVLITDDNPKNLSEKLPRVLS